jgi:hypothetical protein
MARKKEQALPKFDHEAPTLPEAAVEFSDPEAPTKPQQPSGYRLKGGPRQVVVPPPRTSVPIRTSLTPKLSLHSRSTSPPATAPRSDVGNSGSLLPAATVDEVIADLRKDPRSD